MRQTVELIVVLCLSVLLVRTFSAEAYVVPTGSMAPTLLGWHRELVCPSCHAGFVIGIEEERQSGEAICPNCGKRNLDDSSIECGGDRVLVEKFLYALRRPRRWEVAVFHFPGEPSQAYVKRVVGLPGESIRIKGGDVFVNDQVARKSLAEIRAMRILVHDSRFQPEDASRFPRWVFRSEADDGSTFASGWKRQGTGFVHTALPAARPASDDWVFYKHWDAGLGGYGCMTDFHGYNGSEPRQLNEIKDVGTEAKVTLGPSIESISVALSSGADRFVLRIANGESGAIELLRNDRAVPISHPSNPLAARGLKQRTIVLEAALVDRRFQAAIDGQLLFEPFDFDDSEWRGVVRSKSPLELGVRGGEAEVSEIRVYRDIYYTGMLANTPRQPHGLRSGVKLGVDEFFVLGDNSSVSNDSRFWSEGPVVRGSMFVGKPFLVHLPGELVPLKVFGRSFCWVPDPRRIRYIR